MSDRGTVLITGGTRGLGFRTAEAILARDRGRDVVITGRDAATLREATARLGERATGLPLDLTSLAEVRRFAAELPPVRAVVCNAGVQVTSGTERTADGIEMTFGVNHLAHFLLVRELLPRMVRPGRVVFVSSGTHDPRQPTGMPAAAYGPVSELADPPDNGDGPGTAGRRRYTTSKLCNVLTAYEFARRTPPGEVTVNAFDPGLMPGTGLVRDYHPAARFAWRYVAPVLTVMPGVHTAAQSGAALARLVLDPELAGVTGRYFAGRRETHSSRKSYDQEAAAELWAGSEDLIDA